MRALNRWSSLAGCLALAVGISGAAHAQTAAEWDQVVAAAKKEGRLALYIANVGSPENAAMIKLFETKYGIAVDKFESPPPALAERVRTEVNTGRTIGDVSIFGGTTHTLLDKGGFLQKHGGIPNAKNLVVKPSVEPEIPTSVNAYSIFVNTNLVPPDQEPKSWLELLDPKWKGRLLSNDFDVPGAGQSFFSVLLDKFGREFHEKLAKQNVTFFGGGSRTEVRRVASGEFAAIMPVILGDIKNYPGLPIKALIPNEGLPFTPVSVATIKGAPHPNAARLFLNFMLEPETQLIYASSGIMPTIGGLESRVAEDRRWMITPKLLGRQELEGQDERMQLANKIYKGR